MRIPGWWPLLLSLSALTCDGGPVGTSGSLSIRLSASALAVAQGDTGEISVSVGEGGGAANITVSVSGVPSGASALFQAAGGRTSGLLLISAGDALTGDYPLMVEASDGARRAAAPLALTVRLTPRMSGPYRWTSTGPLLSAIADASHPIVSVKDPSVVFFGGQWHVFATTASTAGVWSMVYLHFGDWSQASAARPYYMNAVPGYGDHAAPEVFYFRPHRKWYLVSEWGAQYSTNDDITKPEGWTPPRDFFSSPQPGLENGLDFWVICDDANCYLFFTDDRGHFYRCQTSIDRFPQGFSAPVLVMQTPKAGDLFEGGNTYRIKGTGQFLTLVEGFGTRGRAFRAFITDRLDGPWTPLRGAGDWSTPFLGAENVEFAAGVSPWTADFSHGEMIRDGYDETLTIDPANMQFLYQGLDLNHRSGDYSQLPWQLALVRAWP